MCGFKFIQILSFSHTHSLSLSLSPSPSPAPAPLSLLPPRGLHLSLPHSLSLTHIHTSNASDGVRDAATARNESEKRTNIPLFSKNKQKQIKEKNTSIKCVNLPHLRMRAATTFQDKLIRILLFSLSVRSSLCKKAYVPKRCTLFCPALINSIHVLTYGVF